jgi:hypothetical protein
MNWFRKHLNWTMFLSWILALIIFLVSIPLYAQRENADVILYFMGFYFVVILLVSAWVLRQKGRSLWYLCLFFLREIYVIIICSMENRRTIIDKSSQL